VARVVVAKTATDDLDRLMTSRSLPESTRARVRAQLRPLTTFPRLGRELERHWAPLRAIGGPWPWMLLVYAYDEGTDVVTVVTIADTRTAAAPR
jgi:plasmid stabilization system protein ParE